MLNGLRVVEFEGLGPGPFCGMLQADLGADVVVIHRPQAGTLGSGMLDRGKRSIVLDLKDPADREVMDALVDRADVVIEGFRPGVADRLGGGASGQHASCDRSRQNRRNNTCGSDQGKPARRQKPRDQNHTRQAAKTCSEALAFQAPALTPQEGADPAKVRCSGARSQPSAGRPDPGNSAPGFPLCASVILPGRGLYGPGVRRRPLRRTRRAPRPSEPQLRTGFPT